MPVEISTEEGGFLACFTAQGLARLEFPKSSRGSSGAEPAQTTTESYSVPAVLSPWYNLTREALRQRLRGREVGTLPPLDLSEGTAFQRQVWQALLRIPCGQTCSYSELAAAVKNPAAVRAVGRACGANPIPILIPCHRVLAKGGGLGGFSAGLAWKRLLLQREGWQFPKISSPGGALG